MEGQLRTILVGLDPAMQTGSGIVIADAFDFRILGHESWVAKNATEGVYYASMIAEKVAAQYGGPETQFKLIAERPYHKQWLKRFNSLKAAKEFAKRGFVTVHGAGNNASTSLNRCVGIFLCKFPNYLDYTASEWRNLSGVVQTKGSHLKKNAITRALELIEIWNKDCPSADRLRAAIERTQNDNLAEAYCITYAGFKAVTANKIALKITSRHEPARKRRKKLL